MTFIFILYLKGNTPKCVASTCYVAGWWYYSKILQIFFFFFQEQKRSLLFVHSLLILISPAKEYLYRGFLFFVLKYKILVSLIFSIISQYSLNFLSYIYYSCFSHFFVFILFLILLLNSLILCFQSFLFSNKHI